MQETLSRKKERYRAVEFVFTDSREFSAIMLEALWRSMLVSILNHCWRFLYFVYSFTEITWFML